MEFGDEAQASRWGRGWEPWLVLSLLLFAVWVAVYFYQRTRENQLWAEGLKQKQELVEEFNKQIVRDNQAESENIQRLQEGKGNDYMEDRIIEYTGKIRPEQVLLPISEDNIAKIPDVVGLAEVVAYHQPQARKPPNLTLMQLKVEERQLMESLPPAPVLELESVETE